MCILGTLCGRCHGSLSSKATKEFPHKKMHVRRLQIDEAHEERPDLELDVEMPQNENVLLNMDVPQNAEVDDHEIMEIQDMEMQHERELPENDGNMSGEDNRIQEVPPSIEVMQMESHVSRSVPDLNNDLESQATTATSGLSQSQSFIGVQIHSIPSSQRKCCVCKQQAGRQAIPKTAIVAAWLDTRVFVPFKNRTCSSHLENGTFTSD